MIRRLTVFLVCTFLCLSTQLACTNDPPPSVALREVEQAHPKPGEPGDGEGKRREAKRGDIEPDGPSGNIPEGLEMIVDQVGPAPLPYQSIRLRFTFHNKGKQAIADIRLLWPCIQLARLKGPKDEAFRPPLDPSKFDMVYYTLIRPQASGNGLTYPVIGVRKMIREERLTLQPGEQISISGVIGSWRAEDGIFKQPGDYHLQLAYISDDFRLPVKLLTVTVSTPQGADAEALKFLQQRDASLAGFTGAVRYDNVWLSNNRVPYYKELVEKYSKSTYADYARYLLTCRGSSVKNFDTFEEAIKMRESIDYKTFAFGADVLLSIRRETQEKAHLEKIDEKLDADFFDTDVWIKDQAERLTFAQLMERRKPPAERKQPQPAKP